MDSSDTSSRTLAFIRKPTELGWAEFVDRYGPRLLSWCRSRGLDHHACEDVTQEVLKRLHRSMTTYKQGKSFRGWLFTVTLNAIRDYVTAARNGQLVAIEGIEVLEDHADQGADYVARKDTLAVAMERARARTPPRQWHVFELHVLRDTSYDDLEEQLELDRATLMNYVRNVRKTIKEEMAELDGDS